MVYRDLKFAIPQRVSSIDVMASFENACWGLERHLRNDNSKELAAATPRSVALNYIQRKNPTTSQDAVPALSSWTRSEASVNDTSKFRSVPPERPKSKGRPPKHYHLLLSKEINATIYRPQNPPKGHC